MKQLLWGISFLVFVSVALTYIYIRSNPSPLPPVRTKTASPTSGQKPNLLTQDHEFINSRYGYKLYYSDIFEISTSNPEVASQVNFRKKSDTATSQSGISLWVIDSNQDLRDACKTSNLKRYGILCPAEKITFNPILDAIPWVTYANNLIGITPSGYVFASTHSQGKIYMIVNHSYERAAADVFISNFSFTD